MRQKLEYFDFALYKIKELKGQMQLVAIYNQQFSYINLTNPTVFLKMFELFDSQFIIGIAQFTDKKQNPEIQVVFQCLFYLSLLSRENQH